MISAISSYRIPEPRKYSRDSKLILPGLERTCRDLRTRNFPAIDILITSDDVLGAINSTLTKGDIKEKSYDALEPVEYLKVAQAIVYRIHTAIRVKGQFHLSVSALATNIPNISRIDLKDENGEDTAIQCCREAKDELTISLLVAHLLDTPVVAIVCGRRIASCTRNNTQIVSFSQPTDVKDNPKTELFAAGVIEAFQKAQDALGTGLYPNVGVSLEMEPDVMALADGPEAWIKIYEYLLERAKPIDEHADALDTLVDHIGLNLDLGHVMVSVDRNIHRRGKNSNRDYYIQKLIDDVKAIKVDYNPIFHYHISDHAMGAHWMDAPLLKFRQSKEYITMLEALWDMDGKTRSRFSSKAIAIELEACKERHEVGNSRNTLRVMLENNPNISLESEEDDQDKIERLIGETTIKRLKLGWHDGINRKLYEAVEFLSRVPFSGDPSDVEVSRKLRLFDDITLKAIHSFLAARRNDARTKHAYDIIRLTFAQTGCHMLTHWFEKLIKKEYGLSFYKGYRDHSVHVVYVYLLGWYLYRHIPTLREKLNTDKTDSYIAPSATDPFSRKWVLASLAHDFGYIFESDSGAVQDEAIGLINEFSDQYPIRSIFRRVRDEEKEFLKGTTGDATLTEILKKSIVPEVDEDKLAELKDEIDKRSVLFDTPNQILGMEDFAKSSPQTKKFRELIEDDNHYTTPDLEKFMNICTSGPDLEEEGTHDAIRRPFHDHGVMSALLLNHLFEVHKIWAKALLELSKTEYGADDEYWKKWSKNNEEADRKFWQDEDIREVQHAIAVHNIWPENGPKPHMFSPEKVAEKCPKLATFKYGGVNPDGKDEWLAMFLGLCDSLQEWDRNRFKSPLESDAISLGSLDMHTRVDLKPDGKNATVNFSFPTVPKLGASKDKTLEDMKIQEFTHRFRSDTWDQFITLNPEPDDD